MNCGGNRLFKDGNIASIYVKCGGLQENKIVLCGNRNRLLSGLHDLGILKLSKQSNTEKSSLAKRIGVILNQVFVFITKYG